MSWYMQALRNYANFSGRARRKEYWWFTLINIIIFMVLGGLSGIGADASGQLTTVGTILTAVAGIYMLATLIPSIAVTVRRLHDGGRSGWWILVSLITVIGGLILLVFMFFNSQSEENKWGPNPKAGEK